MDDRARSLRRLLALTAVGGLSLVSGLARGVPVDEPRPSPALEANALLETRAPEPEDLDILLRRLDAEERGLRAELESMDAELRTIGERVVLRGRAYYRTVHAGLLPAGGGFDALVDHAARVERARLALLRDLDRRSQLETRAAAIHERITRLRAERAPLEIHRQAMARARVALRQADERRTAFERAFETSNAPADYVAIYGAGMGPVEDEPIAGFGALRGRLPFPVAGRAEVRRLEKPGGGGVLVELVAQPGAAARSVAPGRVVFADRFEEEAITVVLDHGDRYFTLYGNLASVDVRVGENLPSGSRLGEPRRRGRDAVLSFEIRKNGETIDPAPFLGL